MNRLLRGFCAALALSGAASGLLAQGRGDLWEMSMSMQGFNMPKRQVCQFNDPSKKSNVPMEESCTIESHQDLGNRQITTVKCKEGRMKMDMTGSYDQGAYKGTIEMLDGRNATTMQMEGRLISKNSCDLPKPPPAPAPVDICPDLIKSGKSTMSSRTFLGVFNQNCASRKAEYCQLFSREAMPLIGGYTNNNRDHSVRLKKVQVSGAKPPEDYGWQIQSDFCGLDAQMIAVASCERAVNSPNVEYFKSECPNPDELVKAQCLGRKSTSDIAPRYQKFCAAWGEVNLAQNQAEDEVEIGEKGEVIVKNRNAKAQGTVSTQGAAQGSSDSKSSGASGGVQGAVQGAVENATQTIKGVGNAIRGLFGR